MTTVTAVLRKAAKNHNEAGCLMKEMIALSSEVDRAAASGDVARERDLTKKLESIAARYKRTAKRGALIGV